MPMTALMGLSLADSLRLVITMLAEDPALRKKARNNRSGVAQERRDYHRPIRWPGPFPFSAVSPRRTEYRAGGEETE
jgi:hypothetical protein